MERAARGRPVPVSDWPVPHRHPLLPIVVSAEEPPRKYLLRIDNAHSFSAPLAFVSESYLYRSEQRVSLILGIYFGLAGLAVTLSVLSAASLRDTAYGLYGLSVALMALTQASMTGIAGLHLWPGLPWWNDVSPLVLSVLTVASLLWFWLGGGVAAGALAPAHAGGVGHGGPGCGGDLRWRSWWWRLRCGSRSWCRTSCGLCTGRPAGHCCGRGAAATASACGCCWAHAPVMLASGFPLARIAGLIPVSFMTMHGMQMGIAFELPVLLVILMLRSQQRREHNRRIQGLDRLDPATGLINAPGVRRAHDPDDRALAAAQAPERGAGDRRGQCERRSQRDFGRAFGRGAAAARGGPADVGRARNRQRGPPVRAALRHAGGRPAHARGSSPVPRRAWSRAA
jgi:hypothetical protein